MMRYDYLIKSKDLFKALNGKMISSNMKMEWKNLKMKIGNT